MSGCAAGVLIVLVFLAKVVEGVGAFFAAVARGVGHYFGWLLGMGDK